MYAGGCHGCSAAVERSQQAHPQPHRRRGGCRGRPQGGGARRHQAAAGKPDPGTEVGVGRGGGTGQLLRGRADLLLRLRAATVTTLPARWRRVRVARRAAGAVDCRAWQTRKRSWSGRPAPGLRRGDCAMSGGNNPRPTSPAPAVAAPPDRYAQQLRRGMKVAGNVLITLSGITPAVSVFVIAPVAFKGQGSGAFLAYIIAAIIGVGMAMSWGELGSAYPIAGGDYSIAARVLGRFTGFLMFVLFLVLMIFVPSSIALGGAAYISVVYPGANPNLIGALIIIVTALVAMLTIRVN